LETITDTKDGDTGIKHSGIHAGSVLVVHRVGRARQDNTLGLEVEISHLLSARQEFTVHTQFTDTAGDQVGVLGPKVQDKDGVKHFIDLGNVFLFKYGHCEEELWRRRRSETSQKIFSWFKRGKEAGSNVKPKPLLPVSIFDILTPPQAPALLLTVKCFMMMNEDG
jgi:hypothetical protein